MEHSEKSTPEAYLWEHDRLTIRLMAISVDSISGGGARATFEIRVTGDEKHTPALLVCQEAPEFRAAAIGGVLEANYEAVAVEAAARLREDLQGMMDALDRVASDLAQGRPFPVPGERGLVFDE